MQAKLVEKRESDELGKLVERRLAALTGRLGDEGKVSDELDTIG